MRNIVNQMIMEEKILSAERKKMLTQNSDPVKISFKNKNEIQTCWNIKSDRIHCPQDFTKSKKGVLQNE